MKEQAYAILRQNVSAHWWNVSRDRILSELIESLGIPSQGNVLELGVGTGAFLSSLRFSNKFGIDTNIYGELCNNFQFIQADVNRLPLQENTIDLLLLIDVLEHIEDDKRLIEDCLKTLKRNGKLVISVPALKILWSDLDEIGMHFRRYTARGLTKLLTDIDINKRIIRSSYINFFLFPYIYVFRMIQRLFKQVKKNYDSSNLRMPNKFVNSIFKFIFSSERLFLRFLNFPIGVTCICIVEKD